MYSFLFLIIFICVFVIGFGIGYKFIIEFNFIMVVGFIGLYGKWVWMYGCMLFGGFDM